MGDILTGIAIAASGCPLQHPVNIDEADGNAIQFGFAGKFQKQLRFREAVEQALGALIRLATMEDAGP